jgi:hypothetical protein
LNRDATLNFEPLTLNRKDACDASLRDINGRVDFSATGIFHAHRIIVAEGWVVGLGMVQSKVIYRTKRDHRIFKFLNR